MANIAPVEAEENDYDSTFGGDRSSIASSSTSLTSSITAYEFEHGRRYHAYQAGQYNFPNDEQELNRMDIEHQNQLLQMNDALHMCPLDDPKEILDIGTGSGIWAMDMADAYPSCQVVGTDLSPVQPQFVPPNCRFEIESCEDVWIWGENRFDMIHERFLFGSISDHATLYKEVFKALKPGGWFEVVEMECGAFSDDGTLPADSPNVQWWKLLEEAFHKLGKPMPKLEGYGQLLEDAGFTNITCQLMKRPSNDWPKDPRMKEIGKFSCLNFLEGLEGFTLKPFTRGLGWSKEECQVLIAKTRSEAMSRKVHAWQKGFVWCAQKPYEANHPAPTAPEVGSVFQPTPASQPRSGQPS